MSWSVEGTYMETCNCQVACPCIFLSDPTEGECGALIGWHVDSGADDGVVLDGLTVAMAVMSPGNMATTPWKVALYIDDRATETQKQSLLKIFSGQGGGHPAALAAHVGEVLGAATVPMVFDKRGKHFALTVGDVAEATVEALTGQNDDAITIANHPLAVAPGHLLSVGKSRNMRFRDHGMTWSEHDKSALFSPFSYQG